MPTQAGSALPCFLVLMGTWIGERQGLSGFNEPATRLFEPAPSPPGNRLAAMSWPCRRHCGRNKCGRSVFRSEIEAESRFRLEVCNEGKQDWTNSALGHSSNKGA